MERSEMSSSQIEDYPERTSEKNKNLLARARSLGEILREHPDIQSNSPELYLLGYLKNLGSRKI